MRSGDLRVLCCLCLDETEAQPTGGGRLRGFWIIYGLSERYSARYWAAEFSQETSFCISRRTISSQRARSLKYSVFARLTSPRTTVPTHSPAADALSAGSFAHADIINI